MGLFYAKYLANDPTQACPNDRRQPVDPLVAPDAGHKRWSKRACGVHGGAADRTAPEHVEGTCCANGEGRQLAHRARIRRDRGNHEYENVRQEQLQAERLDGAAARNGRTQVCAQPLDRLAEVGNM